MTCCWSNKLNFKSCPAVMSVAVNDILTTRSTIDVYNNTHYDLYIQQKFLWQAKIHQLTYEKVFFVTWDEYIRKLPNHFSNIWKSLCKNQKFFAKYLYKTQGSWFINVLYTYTTGLSYNLESLYCTLPINFFALFWR